MPARRRLAVPAAALLAWAAGGCRGEQPYGAVEGVVRLDGRPLADAEVVFMPDPERGGRGRRSVALTGKDGRYRVAGDGGRTGAPVGFHRVCVNDLLAGRAPDDEPKGPAGTPAPPPDPKKSRFPEEYSTPSATPLRDIEVREGSQVIDLDLKGDLRR